MEIIEEKERFSIKVTIKDNYSIETFYIATRGKPEDEIFDEKVKLIEKIASSGLRFMFVKKSLIKAYMKIEPRFEEIYKKIYSEELSDYNFKLKKDEKEFLDKWLDYYRKQNN